jgi:uncharacterized protein YkwD
MSLGMPAAIAAPSTPRLSQTTRSSTPTGNATSTRSSTPTRHSTLTRHSTPAKRPSVPCPGANLRPTASNLAAVDAATLCLVQRTRAAAHLRPLRFNAPLQSVAAGQARDMVRGDYFGDDSLLGLTPMQRVLASAYPTRSSSVQVAQNIGWGTGPTATPAGMLAAWMRSAPHRAIILTAAFRDIGVGVAPAAPPSLARGLAGATYTLELGERISAESARARTEPGRLSPRQ